MKIIIASDSHGRNSILDLIPYYYPADYYIHCGDLEDDPEYYEPWLFVEGNNDEFWGEAFRIIECEQHRIFVVHSHQCNPYYRKEDLANWAKENQCDIACYGHTHIADIDTKFDVLLINPGSLQEPRDDKECSFCILTIEKNTISTELVFEPEWAF